MSTNITTAKEANIGNKVSMKAVDMDTAPSTNPPDLIDYAKNQASTLTTPIEEGSQSGQGSQSGSVVDKAAATWNEAGETMRQEKEQRINNMAGVAEYPPTTTTTQNQPSIFDSVKHSIEEAVAAGQRSIERLSEQVHKAAGPTETHTQQSAYTVLQTPQPDGSAHVTEEWQKKVDDNPMETSHKEAVINP